MFRGIATAAKMSRLGQAPEVDSGDELVLAGLPFLAQEDPLAAARRTLSHAERGGLCRLRSHYVD